MSLWYWRHRVQLHPAFHLVMVPCAPRLPRRRPSGSVRSRTSKSCARVHGEAGISPSDSQRLTTGGDTLHTAAAWRTEVTVSTGSWTFLSHLPDRSGSCGHQWPSETPRLADDPNTRVGAHARTRPLVGRWEVCLANEQAQREVRDSFKDGRTPDSRLAQREPLSPAIRHLPD